MIDPADTRAVLRRVLGAWKPTGSATDREARRLLRDAIRQLTPTKDGDGGR